MMKITTFFAALLLVFSSYGQELPKPSPKGETKQRVGLTDVTISYSRPGVKGRTIWGELVPYGEMWRTGANAATSVEFTDDVKVNGNDLKAGKYALYTIPGEKEWEVVFNSNTESWGTSNYKSENDVLKLKVKPETSTESIESMRISVEDISDNSANIQLAWEKLRLNIPFTVEVEEKAWINIGKAIADAETDEQKAAVFRNGASYCADTGKKLEKGLDWINRSIELKDAWYSYWTKAEVLAAMGKHDEAIATAKECITKGEAEAKEKGEEFRWKGRLEQMIKEWESKKG